MKSRKERAFLEAMGQLDVDGKTEFDFLDVSSALEKLGLHNNIQRKDIPLTLKCYQRVLGIECMGKFPTGIGKGKRCRYRFKPL